MFCAESTRDSDSESFSSGVVEQLESVHVGLGVLVEEDSSSSLALKVDKDERLRLGLNVWNSLDFKLDLSTFSELFLLSLFLFLLVTICIVLVFFLRLLKDSLHFPIDLPMSIRDRELLTIVSHLVGQSLENVFGWQ